MEDVADPFAYLDHDKQAECNSNDYTPFLPAQQDKPQHVPEGGDDESHRHYHHACQHRPDQRHVRTEPIHPENRAPHAAVCKDVDHRVKRQGSEDDAAALSQVIVRQIEIGK